MQTVQSVESGKNVQIVKKKWKKCTKWQSGSKWTAMSRGSALAPHPSAERPKLARRSRARPKLPKFGARVSSSAKIAQIELNSQIA